jgi:hypothetical protein
MFAVVVKPTSRSKGTWDFFEQTGVVPAAEVYPEADAALCQARP